MNWTGGRLQTSRNAGSNITAIQKKHFAKVRARVHKTPNTLSTFRFSWAKPQVEDDDPFRGEVHSRSSHGRGPKTHHILNDPDASAPIATQLTPNRARHTPKPLQNRRNIRAGDRDPQIERFRSRRSPSVIELSPRAYSESLSYATQHGPKDGKARYGENPSPSDDGGLEAQRRKLLQQRDWVGLEITNPVKMAFPVMKDRDRVGKRRKLKETDHNRNQGYAAKRIKPNIVELEDLNRRKRPAHHHVDEKDISVRIGSSIHGTQSTAREASIKPKRSHSSPESEEMLLDHETEFMSHNRDQTPLDSVVNHRQRLVQPLTPDAHYESVVGRGSLSDHGSTCLGNLDQLAAKPIERLDSTGLRRHMKHKPNTKPESITEPTRSDPPLAVYKAPGRLIFSSSPCPQACATDFASNDLADGDLKPIIRSVSVNASVPTVAPSQDSDNVRWKKYLAIPASSGIKNMSASSPPSLVAPGGVASIENVVEDEHPVPPDQAVTEIVNPRVDPDYQHSDSIAQSPNHPNVCTGNSEIPPPNRRSADVSQEQERKPIDQLKNAQRNGLQKDMEEASGIIHMVESPPDEDSIWYSFVFGDEVLEHSCNVLEDNRTAKVMHHSSFLLLTHAPEPAPGPTSATHYRTLDTLSLIANASDPRSVSPLMRDPGLDNVSMAANASDYRPITPVIHTLKYPLSSSSSLPPRRLNNLSSSPDELARSMNSSLFEKSDGSSRLQHDPPARSKIFFTKPSLFQGPQYMDPPPTICVGKSFGSTVMRGDRDVAVKRTKASKRREPEVAEAMEVVEDIEDD